MRIASWGTTLVAAGIALGCATGGGGTEDQGRLADGGRRVDGSRPGIDAGELERSDGAILPGLDGGQLDGGQDAGPPCPPSCDDGDFCTIDGCAADGTCTHVANTCDDGNACTVDACMSAGFCRNDRATVMGDTCSAPIDVSAGGTFMGTSTCAASDFAGACGAGDDPDVFLRVTLATASDVTIDTTGSSYDTVLSMGTSCAAMDVTCDDDGAGGGAARLTRSALAAGTYYVALDGKSGGAGGSWRAAVTITPLAVPETVTFPQSTDTSSSAYIWQYGGYIQGARSTSLASTTSLDMSLVPTSNGLTCDTQDMRLMVNGTEVGRFVVSPGSVAPITRTFTFGAIAGPTYTFRYENVRQVAGGCGAAQLGSSMPASTITLRP
ncbi:MAG: hypothetical protein M3Y87_11840 [Myxococcota bacterium]|nr:hypothetical protein [Myxococcota bacterium]